MTTERRHTTIAVIGGGVAGTVAAIRLAHHGAKVSLFEKRVFPREKVCGCCLGFAGLNALDAIGMGDHVREAGNVVNEFECRLPDSSSSLPRSFVVPVRPGVAIARGRLDAMLIDQARKVGVNVMQPATAEIIADEDVTQSVHVQYREGATMTWHPPRRYDLAIVAGGLTGRCFRTSRSQSNLELPWIESPNGPLGVSAHLPADDALAQQWRIDPNTIQMLCTNDGYLGIVRLPGGGLDLAAAIGNRHRNESRSTDPSSEKRSDTTTRGRDIWLRPIEAMVRHAACLPARQLDAWARWLQHDATWLTTPPLRRRRLAARHRIVAIGDAAGYVEPLTGEGMTWGIESGIAIADQWVHHNDDAFAEHWNRHIGRLLRRRRRVCDLVTRALRRQLVRTTATAILHRMPSLARPLTWNLARGPRFEVTSFQPNSLTDRVA